MRAVDANRNTALHLACQRRQSPAALVLLDHINETSVEGEAAQEQQQQQHNRASIINMANKQMRTPLHLAARNGLVSVTRRLLQQGASVVAVDADGLTPALACAPNPTVARCLATILAANGEYIPISMPRLYVLLLRRAYILTFFWL